jgi:hypothetical protein
MASRELSSRVWQRLSHGAFAAALAPAYFQIADLAVDNEAQVVRFAARHQIEGAVAHDLGSGGHVWILADGDQGDILLMIGNRLLDLLQ